MATKKKLVKKEPKKVLVNYKILKGEKNALKSKANKYSGGNVTKLIRLLARGYFVPTKVKKAA